MKHQSLPAFVGALATALMGLVGPCVAVRAAEAPVAAPLACPALLNFKFARLQDDAPQDLCQYSGKVVLVVNTASYCGFTSQYQGLEALYAKYEKRGLVVLGFPSNDFVGVEEFKLAIQANFGRSVIPAARSRYVKAACNPV